MKHIKTFKKIADYTVYKSDSEHFIIPNISFVEETDGVFYKTIQSISNAIITCDSATYDGQNHIATNIVVTLYGETLINGVDYTVSGNNGGTNAGNYAFTINGIGSYIDSKQGTFTINKANRIMSWSSAPSSVEVSDTMTAIATKTGDGSIVYSSSNTNIATINSSTGVITGIGAGSCIITASVLPTTNYNNGSISYTLNSIGKEQKYFIIESLEDDNTISLKASNTNLTKTISISTDNGTTWIDKTSTISGVTLATLDTGDKILVKGSNISYGNSSYYNYFASTKEFNVEGNIMSLIYGDNSIGQTTLDSNGYNFKYLFRNCTKLKSAEHLSLPATTLANNCYEDMFYGCTNLTTAPELPATTLTSSCYNSMFQNCTGLTTTPELPATTLADYCYYSMFQVCTALTTAPELPATTLSYRCYEYMFGGCTSLTTAPELPATTLASSCYSSMFNGCTSLTTAPELLATTLAEWCYVRMFQNCTSLTTAPELPATTLASSCYSIMFSGCTNLTTAPELTATTLTESCYSSMFSGCTSLTTAPELPATTLASNCYYNMFNGCTALTTAPELPVTTLTSSCYSSMFSGCTSLTTAPELPAITLIDDCYSSMFNGCTSLTTAPELPAITLADYCYNNMFYGCTSLNYIKCLATDISAYDCTTEWVYNVPLSGTFVKATSMTSWTRDDSGIPSGWTVQNV